MSNTKLEESFNFLSESLKSSDMPQWGMVYFAEGFFIDCWSVKTIERDKLYSMDEYSDRFDVILSRGHGWINMSALGLLDNNLIVGIEEPSGHSPSFKVGAQNTSVNVSGPMRCVKDKNYNLKTFVRIKK